MVAQLLEASRTLPRVIILVQLLVLVNLKGSQLSIDGEDVHFVDIHNVSHDACVPFQKCPQNSMLSTDELAPSLKRRQISCIWNPSTIHDCPLVHMYYNREVFSVELN